jgi:hypothetical protein
VAPARLRTVNVKALLPIPVPMFWMISFGPAPRLATHSVPSVSLSARVTSATVASMMASRAAWSRLSISGRNCANSSALPWKMIALRAGSVTIRAGRLPGAGPGGAPAAPGGGCAGGRPGGAPGGGGTGTAGSCVNAAPRAGILPARTAFSTPARLSAVVLRTP